VKIRIDILKPLSRGRVLKFQGEPVWIAFQNERLPKFCFHCGVIRHRASSCLAKSATMRPGEPSSVQFGTWLRASPSFRRTGSRRGLETGKRSTESRTRKEQRRMPASRRIPGRGESQRRYSS
jgi:hypothetical protein